MQRSKFANRRISRPKVCCSLNGVAVARVKKKFDGEDSRSERESDTLYSRDTRASEREKRASERAKRKIERNLEAEKLQQELLVQKVTRRWVRFDLSKRNEFLKVYREGMTIREAANHVGVSFNSVMHQKKNNPRFHALFEKAREQKMDGLEDHLMAMAEGRAKGNVLAIFGILRANRPEKWRESAKVEHSGSVGLAVTPDLLKEARERVSQNYGVEAEDRKLDS